MSIDRFKYITVDNNRICSEQDERNDTGLVTIVDPVVDRTLLDAHIAFVQVDNNTVIELHVNLTLHHHHVVEGLRPMHSWCYPRVVLANP